MECSWGEVHLGWESNDVGLKGWQINTDIAQDDTYPEFEKFGQMQIPFWFPTMIPAAMLLWWVWRKTRAKAMHGSFLAEPPNPSGPRGGKAE
jgi:hypothetical protein